MSPEAIGWASEVAASAAERSEGSLRGSWEALRGEGWRRKVKMQKRHMVSSSLCPIYSSYEEEIILNMANYIL